MDMDRLFRQYEEDPSYLPILKREISRKNDFLSYLKLISVLPPKTVGWRSVLSCYVKAIKSSKYDEPFLTTYINETFSHWPEKLRFTDLTLESVGFSTMIPNEDAQLRSKICKRIFIFARFFEYETWLLDNPQITHAYISNTNFQEEYDFRRIPQITSFRYTSRYKPGDICTLISSENLEELGMSVSSYVDFRFEGDFTKIKKLRLEFSTNGESEQFKTAANLLKMTTSLEELDIGLYAYSNVDSEEFIEEVKRKIPDLKKIDLKPRSQLASYQLQRLGIRSSFLPKLEKFSLTPYMLEDSIDWVAPQTMPSLKKLTGFLTDRRVIRDMETLKRLKLFLQKDTNLDSFFSKKTYNPSITEFSIKACYLTDKGSVGFLPHKGCVKYLGCFPNLRVLKTSKLNPEKQYIYIHKLGSECKLDYLELSGSVSAPLLKPVFPESITHMKGSFEETPNVDTIFKGNTCLMSFEDAFSKGYSRFIPEEEKEPKKDET